VDLLLIKNPTRSRFIEALRAGVKLERFRLEEGRCIDVKLKPRGYQGKWSVIIHPDASHEFKVVGTSDEVVLHSLCR
jgi:hypothetical protein